MTALAMTADTSFDLAGSLRDAGSLIWALRTRLFGSTLAVTMGFAVLDLFVPDVVRLTNIASAIALAWLCARHTRWALDEIAPGSAARRAEPGGKVRTMFGIALLGNLAVLLGSLLFVVPGVVLWIGWCVSAPAAIDRNLGATDAMKASFELTRTARLPLLAFAGLSLALVSAVVVLGAWRCCSRL
jgi:hypothetical protein